MYFNYQFPKPHSATASSRWISSPADHEWLNKTKSSFCASKKISFTAQAQQCIVGIILVFATHISASANHLKMLYITYFTVHNSHTENNLSLSNTAYNAITNKQLKCACLLLSHIFSYWEFIEQMQGKQVPLTFVCDWILSTACLFTALKFLLLYMSCNTCEHFLPLGLAFQYPQQTRVSKHILSICAWLYQECPLHSAKNIFISHFICQLLFPFSIKPTLQHLLTFSKDLSQCDQKYMLPSL